MFLFKCHPRVTKNKKGTSLALFSSNFYKPPVFFIFVMVLDELLQNPEMCYNAGLRLSDDEFSTYKDRIIEGLTEGKLASIHGPMYCKDAGKNWVDERFVPVASDLAKVVAEDSMSSYYAVAYWKQERSADFLDLFATSVEKEVKSCYWAIVSWRDDTLQPYIDSFSKKVFDNPEWCQEAGEGWNDKRFYDNAESLIRSVAGEDSLVLKAKLMWSSDRYAILEKFVNKGILEIPEYKAKAKEPEELEVTGDNNESDEVEKLNLIYKTMEELDHQRDFAIAMFTGLNSQLKKIARSVARIKDARIDELEAVIREKEKIIADYESSPVKSAEESYSSFQTEVEPTDILSSQPEKEGIEGQIAEHQIPERDLPRLDTGAFLPWRNSDDESNKDPLSRAGEFPMVSEDEIVDSNVDKDGIV